jgi:hypothetical protein
LRFFFSFFFCIFHIYFLFFILVCSSHCSLIFISKTNKQTCIGFSLCHPWLWIIFMSFTNKYMFLFSFFKILVASPLPIFFSHDHQVDFLIMIPFVYCHHLLFASLNCDHLVGWLQGRVPHFLCLNVVFGKLSCNYMP